MKVSMHICLIETHDNCMKLSTSLFIIILTAGSVCAQQPLTSDMLEKSAFRFSLNAEGQLEGDTKEKWLDWIGDNQYIGLAEVHNSAQLSLFTKAFLNTLNETGFNNFAVELGPNSAAVIQEITQNPADTKENIRTLSRQYAKSRKPLFVFFDKTEDAEFVEEASSLGMNFWGLDQEYLFSYEMHLDNIHKLAENPSIDLQDAYEKAKALIQKNIFKNKVSGQSVFCWYLSNATINNYLRMMESNKKAKIIIDGMRMSWNIYCKHDQGGSNQLRANYMKKNFNSYVQNSQEANPKVFLKLGGIHLTHGRSTFGVDDMGKFLTEKANSDGTSFLSIRHLIAYRNGKSNIGKSGWKSVAMFLELGRKDQWTVVDLRPFKEMLSRGEITTNDKFQFELNSYDMLLISPDDQYPKPNY